MWSWWREGPQSEEEELCDSVCGAGYLIDLGGVGGAKRTGSLGIGRAAEHLPDHLCDGVTVDAVDFEQVGHFAAAGNVSDSQMLESEAGLIDDSGAHRFSLGHLWNYSR